MIYILIVLQFLGVSAKTKSTIPQWFLIKQGNVATLDLDVLAKFDICFSGNYKQKFHNVTHCLVEVYNEEGCKTLSGTTYYWKGQNIEDIDTYVEEHSYISHVFYEDYQCNTPIQYFLYTKEHCNYESDLNTGRNFYSWYDIQGNKIKYCNIEENTDNCTEEMKKDNHCYFIDTEQCKNTQQWFINFKKFDNGIPPLRLLVVFGILMLFL